MAALTPTPVQGLSASRCIECMFVHAINLTALNIKRETAHKKAELLIDPRKTQSTPSSLALQPSPVGGGVARRVAWLMTESNRPRKMATRASSAMKWRPQSPKHGKSRSKLLA